MKKLLIATVWFIHALNSSVAQAAEGDIGVEADMGDRYCTTCHGVKGLGNIAIQAPRIAGMEAWYLKRQLENFRSGIRGSHDEDTQGIEMQSMAAKLTDESIADIVDWVGGWNYIPAEVTIDGNVNKGRKEYKSCAACHGKNAEGNEALGAPALAGQNDWYMMTQLSNYRAGFRGTHQEDVYGRQMQPMAQTLKDDEAIIDVVSYINTLHY